MALGDFGQQKIGTNMFCFNWLGISQGFPVINRGITIDPRYSNKGISISICLLVNWNDR